MEVEEHARPCKSAGLLLSCEPCLQVEVVKARAEPLSIRNHSVTCGERANFPTLSVLTFLPEAFFAEMVPQGCSCLSILPLTTIASSFIAVSLMSDMAWSCLMLALSSQLDVCATPISVPIHVSISRPHRHEATPLLFDMM